MAMGILLHTMATPELELVDALMLAERLGFDGLEVVHQDGYRCGVPETVSVNDATRFGDQARCRNVPVRVLSAYEKRFAHPDPGIRLRALDGLSRSIEIAGLLGARAVRVLAGEEVAEAEWDAALERLAGALTSLAEEAEGRDILLLVENHMDTMARSAARTAAICRAVAHPSVKILFDPANLETMGDDGFGEGFEHQAGLIAHVHVKDAAVLDGRRVSVVPGTGEDPWPDLLRRLVEAGYAGDVSVEYERRWQPELPPASLALPLAKAFIERCIRDARVRLTAQNVNPNGKRAWPS